MFSSLLWYAALTGSSAGADPVFFYGSTVYSPNAVGSINSPVNTGAAYSPNAVGEAHSPAAAGVVQSPDNIGAIN